MKQNGILALLKRDDGNAVEYSLIVVLIGLAIAAGAAVLGTNLGTFYGSLGNYFSGAANTVGTLPTPGGNNG